MQRSSPSYSPPGWRSSSPASQPPTSCPWRTRSIAQGSNIRNVVLQDTCLLDLSDHAAVAYSPNAAGHVLNALDPAHAKPVPCKLTTPVTAP